LNHFIENLAYKRGLQNLGTEFWERLVVTVIVLDG